MPIPARGFGKDRWGLCFDRRRPPIVGLGRVPLCEVSRPDCVDRFPRYQVRLTNDWQVIRHAAPIHRAVGIKADERPMNLLAPVNSTGASVTRRALNVNRQVLPAEMSPLPCGVFPKYRSSHHRRYFGKVISTVACCGLNMHPRRFYRHPEHLRRIV